MASEESIVKIRVGGHEFRLNAKTDEVPHIERAADKVTDSLEKMQESYGGAASPSKIASMAAFQFAFELSLADAMLDDAQRLHEELKTQRQAVKRLENLLAQVDDALAC